MRLARFGLGWLLASAATLAAQPPAAPRSPTLEELGFPPRAAFDHTRGAFAVRFDTLPESARPRALVDRLSPASKDEPAAIDPRRESWFVFVPAEYDAATPWGLWVWLSPTDFGGVLREDLRALLARERLIWIGAHRADNARAPLERLALALTAAELAPRHWTIDPRRVYVAGYSGGGRLASALATFWPEIFRGGLFVKGCNWYAPLAVPGQPGRIWQPAFREPPRQTTRLLHEERRFVYLTGEKDFNRDEIRATEKAARQAGFRHTLLLEAPGIDHLGPVPLEFWQQAMDFLGATD